MNLIPRSPVTAVILDLIPTSLVTAVILEYFHNIPSWRSQWNEVGVRTEVQIIHASMYLNSSAELKSYLEGQSQSDTYCIPTPLAAAICTIVSIADLLKYRPSPPTTSDDPWRSFRSMEKNMLWMKFSR